MTEDDAWEILHHYAQVGNIRIEQEMSVRVLRRNLAKVFQPRAVDDDDSAMRQINPALDLIEVERDRRELLGIPENARSDNRAGRGGGGGWAAPRWPQTWLGRPSESRGRGRRAAAGPSGPLSPLVSFNHPQTEKDDSPVKA